MVNFAICNMTRLLLSANNIISLWLSDLPEYHDRIFPRYCSHSNYIFECSRKKKNPITQKIIMLKGRTELEFFFSGVCLRIIQEQTYQVKARIHLAWHLASHRYQPDDSRTPFRRALQLSPTIPPQELVFRGILPLNMEVPLSHHG